MPWNDYCIDIVCVVKYYVVLCIKFNNDMYEETVTTSYAA